jgi:hypothetical protein
MHSSVVILVSTLSLVNPEAIGLERLCRRIPVLSASLTQFDHSDRDPSAPRTANTPQDSFDARWGIGIGID